MSTHGRDVILTLEGLFQRHDSSPLMGIEIPSKGFFLSKSQRFNYMNTIVDVIIQPNLRDLPEYSRLIGIVFERLFKLCSDESNDIRIYSEDCLGKLITNLQNTDVPRIILQLQLELQRNAAPRSLRSALRRYADLSKTINPIFLRSFIQDFVPLLLDISNREEEFLLEDFKDSFLIMSPYISSFFLPCNIQVLIQNWLHFLTNSSTIKRRVGASLLTSLVGNCKSSIHYTSLLLQLILGLVPEGQGNVSTLLGVINCLRFLCPFPNSKFPEARVKSEFDASHYTNVIDDEIDFKYILQATVFVFHTTTHPNHNVVNASLDTLAAILNSANPQLVYWFMHGNLNSLFLPILNSICLVNASFMDHNLQRSNTNFDLIDDKYHFESELMQMYTEVSKHSSEISDASALDTTGDESDASTESTDSLLDVNASSLLDESLFESNLEQSNPSNVFELQDSNITDIYSHSCVLDDDVLFLQNAFILELDLMPITRIIRRICRNLLPGIPGSVLPKQSSLVSIQNSSIKCLTIGISLQPELIFQDLFPPIPSLNLHTTQSLTDVFLMFSHTDPTTLEKTCILAASFIKHYLMKVYSRSIESERNFFSIFPHLLKTLLRLLKSTDAMAVRASCLAMKCCLPELLHYCYSGLVVQAIKEYMNVRFHSFWLVRVELCSLLSVINWSGLAMLEATSTNNCSLQPFSIQDTLFSHVIPFLLNDKEPKVRESIQQLVLSVLSSLDARQDSLAPISSNDTSFTFLPYNQINLFQTSLGVVITILSNGIVNHKSKTHFITATQVLSQVAKHYKPLEFPLQWNLLFRNLDIYEFDKKPSTFSPLGLLPYLFHRIYSTLVMLNCLTLSNILFLVTSLFKGSYLLAQKANDQKLNSDIQSIHFLDKEQKIIGPSIFQLIMRMLRIFHVVISRKSIDIIRKRFKSFGIAKEESIIEETKSVTTKKKQNIAQGSRNPVITEKKRPLLGKFSHIPNCMHLLQLLKTAYLGYQRSLHQIVDDRFMSLFKRVIQSFVDLLSCPLTIEFCLYTEEILLYLSSAIQILPSVSLLAIEKFVTVLYQSDVSKQIHLDFEYTPFPKEFSHNRDFYSIPLNAVNRELSNSSVLEADSFSEDAIDTRIISTAFVIKQQKNPQITKSEKAQRLNLFSKKYGSVFAKKAHIDFNKFSFKYQIKHFEGIITYSLNIFGYSANSVQKTIVSLLTRLMCFQLNYSLIDPKCIFLKKITSQLEYIEQGLVSETPGYISTIFQLLVLISVLKPDALSFSKVILLFESAITCPMSACCNFFDAVKPLYNYLYPEVACIEDDTDHLVTNLLSLRRDLGTSDQSNRDILFNLLIRLVEHYKATDLLASIVLSTQAQTHQWKDNSFLIVGPWLQKMKRLQIQLDKPCEFESMQRLLFCLHPDSLNNSSLLFICLSSSKEIDSIKLILRWIAGALLVFKLSLRCNNESELLLQLKGCIVSIPKVAIVDCLEMNELQIGVDLYPQQFLTKFLFHTLFMCTQLLENIMEFTLTQKELSYATSFSVFLVSQILTLILWILKDYSFKSVALTIRFILHRLSLDYVNGHASEGNFFYTILRLRNHFPILFVKCLHILGVESDAPVNFWAKLLKTVTMQSERFRCVFQHFIYSGIVIDIIHKVTLNEAVYISLLKSNSFIDTIATYKKEYWIVGFLDILKSSPECSIILTSQLRALIEHSVSGIYLKDYLFILEYLHMSCLNLLVTEFRKSDTVSRYDSLCNSSMIQTLNCCDVILPGYLLLEDKILQYSLNILPSMAPIPFNIQYIHNIRNLLCITPSSDRSMEHHGILISDMVTCCRNPDFQWYLKKFSQELLPYSIFSIDDLYTLRCIDKPNLKLILSLTSISFEVLQFIIEFSLFQIYQNVHHSNFPEQNFSQADIQEVNNSFFQLLRACSLSFVQYISPTSEITNPTLIFKATRCLLSICDGHTVFPEILNDVVEYPQFLLKFGFRHFQNTMCLSNPLSKVDWLIPALLCLSYIFEIQQVKIILMDFQTLLQAVVKSLFMFISQTLGESFSNRFRFSISNAFPHLRDIENLNILLDILPTHLTERYFPSCLIFPIRSLLISLCHSEQYYNSLIIPLSIFDDIQQFEFIIRSSSFPQLPLSQFRDANGFSEMMKRISTLGWKTKDQFEEIWSLLIKVLVPSNNSELDNYDEDFIDLMKTCCIAIEGITTHLMTYFLYPTAGIRHPSYGLDIHSYGDSSVGWLKSHNGMMATLCSLEDQTFLHTKAGQKISELRRIIEMAFIHAIPYRTSLLFKHNFERVNMFRRNIERSMDYAGYLTIQFLRPPLLKQRSSHSAKYAKDSIDNSDDMMSRRLFDVNITSCIRLLSDLYDVWLTNHPNNVSLNLFHTILKSMFFLSDLFTEESEFEWMLQTCMRIFIDHSELDNISNIYIILSILKSIPNCRKDAYESDRVLDVIQAGLLSKYTSISLCTLEGLIFLFNAKNYSMLSFLVPILPSIILKALTDSQDMYFGLHQRDILVVLSVGISLIQFNCGLQKDQQFSSQFVSQLINYCDLPSYSCNWSVFLNILQTFERLILGFSLQQIDRIAIMKLTLRVLDNNMSYGIFLSSLSLLIVCMYSGEEGDIAIGINKLDNLTELEVDPMTHNIDLISQTRDRISLLLRIIREYSLKDAHYIAKILVQMLLDLLPSNQSLNIIIGEFLHRDQFNKQLIGWIMYKLFQTLYTRGQESEVKIWGLLCINSFAQSPQIRSSVWNLSCLFISVSKNINICNLFPFVLSRVNRLSKWDIEVFLDTAVSFYDILEQDEQRQFYQSICQLCGLHPIFSYLAKLC